MEEPTPEPEKTICMNSTNPLKPHADRLVFLSFLLFLLGLLIGLFIPMLTNQRMGLSAHLEGTMNGMFLVILGLIWSRLALKELWLHIVFWLAIYGTFANFAAVLTAALTGAGKMMPIAGGKEGSPITEGLISFLLISLALAMLATCIITLAGLFRHQRRTTLAANNDSWRS